MATGTEGADLNSSLKGAANPAAGVAPQASSSRPGIVRRMGAAVDWGLMAFFGAIAAFVVRHPIKVMVGAVVLALLLGLGVLRIQVATNSEDLYTPQGSQAFKDRDYVEALYGYPKNEMVIYVTSPGDGGENVLTKPILLSFLDLYNELLQVNSSYKGSSYSLESPEVCYRPGGPGTPCAISSVLAYWNYSQEAIENDPDILSTVANPNALDPLGQTISPEAVMGGISFNSSGGISQALAFKMLITLQNNQPKSGSGEVDGLVQAWQQAAVPAVKDYSSSEAEYYVTSTWYEGDVSDKAITADISLLIVGYFLLILYGMVVLSKPHPVESRSYMGLLNVASIALAVLGSFGFCMLIGIKFSLVTQALALLLLALGTDDMLVTMSSHDDTGKEMPDASIKERIVATVSRARRGVVVASTTNFIAFITGTISEIPALRDFMIYAAVGVILVLIFQSSFFVACLVFDLRRQRGNRLDTLCCIVSSRGPTDGCFGRSYDSNKEGVAQTIIGNWLPRIILHPIGKAAVLLLTVFLLVMGIIGMTQLDQNFDSDWFIPDGSYLKSVYEVRDEYFVTAAGKGVVPIGAYTTNPIDPPLDYFNYQDEIAAISTNLKANKWVASAPPLQSWYDAYIQWLPSSNYSTQLNSNGRPSSSATFYSSLREFLSNDVGDVYKGDVIFSNTTADVITSSRIICFTINLKNSPQEVDAMNSIRDTVETSAPSLDSFAYSFAFLFFEGYAVIAKDTLLAVFIAGAVVFIAMLLLLADVLLSLLVGLVVAIIDIELVGFLYWAGLSFNSVTSINLILAIGVAVDYSAFTAFSFLTQTGTRQERARKALSHLGVAVFNGGFTLFLAILPLALARSFIFQTFFKMFSMIVLLGLWHGLCTLPVVLSFIGSKPYESAIERQELLEAKAIEEDDIESKKQSIDSDKAYSGVTPPQTQGMVV